MKWEYEFSFDNNTIQKEYKGRQKMGKTEDTSETIWSDYETDEYAFWKENETDRIWHAYRKKDPVRGPYEITFDFKKIYNAWSDYPDKMTKEEKEIFDREQPFWRDI